jgi:hypothetical protein
MTATMTSSARDQVHTYVQNLAKYAVETIAEDPPVKEWLVKKKAEHREWLESNEQWKALPEKKRAKIIAKMDSDAGGDVVRYVAALTPAAVWNGAALVCSKNVSSVRLLQEESDKPPREILSTVIADVRGRLLAELHLIMAVTGAAGQQKMALQLQSAVLTLEKLIDFPFAELNDEMASKLFRYLKAITLLVCPPTTPTVQGQ